MPFDQTDTVRAERDRYRAALEAIASDRWSPDRRLCRMAAAALWEDARDE